MLRRLAFIPLLLLVWASPALAQRDMIDLKTVVYHASVNVSDWPVTKAITGIELRPGLRSDGDVGVRPTLSPYDPRINADRWPDFIMWPPAGDLRYTLWLFVRIGGTWHGAAVLEFWKDKVWSGAPLLTQYGDWIYPNPGSPWGEMGNYVPQEGDEVGFMATAGDLRLRKDVFTVRERSNVVTVRLTSTANYTFNYGQPTAAADFDGDGRSDVTVYRPSNGTWYARDSSSGGLRSILFGEANDVPVTGDYDGDGRADTAVYRPATGVWYIRYSSNGSVAAFQWGWAGDQPMPADYDGDGRTDIAVFRPSSGIWYIFNTVNGAYAALQWGQSGDKPMAGDYDGDGKADVAVFRPSNGGWYWRSSATGAFSVAQWGGPNDVPCPGDYDGDGRLDFAVFRPSNVTFYIRLSSTGAMVSYQWGQSDDVPTPGDFDGDGRTDLALFRPSNGTWYIGYTSTMSASSIQWGLAGDVPVLKR